jgi:hypothetical protein
MSGLKWVDIKNVEGIFKEPPAQVGSWFLKILSEHKISLWG